MLTSGRQDTPLSLKFNNLCDDCDFPLMEMSIFVLVTVWFKTRQIKTLIISNFLKKIKRFFFVQKQLNAKIGIQTFA